MTPAVGNKNSNVPLGDLMAEFAAYYDSCSADGERRWAGLQQLMAIASDLQRRGIPTDTLRPLTAVIHALVDVHDGRRPPLLQPDKKAGGQSPPFAWAHQRGLASAAVTLLIDDGAAEKDALEKVAKRITNWPATVNRRRRKTGPNQSVVDALRDWREKAMAGGPAPDAAQYATCLRFFVESGRSHSDFVDLLLTKGPRPFL